MQGYEAVKDSIIKVIKHHIPLRHYRVFYFGSRVTGKATPRSDYDVGIEAGQRIPLEVIARIREDLDEIPMLQIIDLVDFQAIPEGFYKKAKMSVKVIYEQ